MTTPRIVPGSRSFPKAPAIVSWDWVVDRPNVVLADVRFYMDGRSGLLAYRAGHLPGAVFVDLDHWLAAPPTSGMGRHPLPSPAVFAEGMVHCGIGDDSVVVAYDDEAGVWASRLVWMLRALGHEAALLDGGIRGFEGELSTDVAPVPAVTFTAAPWPLTALASVEDVTSGGSVVLDARQAERFRGEVEPIDPKAGHIPGARNLPCRENVSASGHFLPAAELLARFASVGASSESSVISYCGSGVTACQNLLVMEHIGLGPGRLYPGSWSQYCSTDRPVATGP